jgi:protein TonB
MAYADQDQGLSTNRIISIGIVALVHAGLGYALVTGLAFDAAKQVFEDLKTFDVAEEKPEEPEEPPPPPPAPPAPPPPAAPKVAQKAVQKGGSITNDDYPPSAVRNEESGVSVASFTVGTDGKVTACNASGASPTLDAEACKLIIRRFRFKPALDTGGSPIEENKTQRIRWDLPK